MQRVRRLASVVCVAVVGVFALGACGRSAPDVAAYVGDQRITENEVTDIVDEVRDRLTEAAEDVKARADASAKAAGQPTPTATPPVVMPITRQDVVATLVFGELCDRLSADKGYQATVQVSAGQIAQLHSVPADSAYAQQTARLHTCLSGIPSGAPVAPTPEDLADVVARGKAAGAIPAGMSVEEAGPQLDGDQLRGALGARKAFTEAVSGYDVTVNPRYRPLEFPLLPFQDNTTAVGVPLGEGDPGTVVDAR